MSGKAVVMPKRELIFGSLQCNYILLPVGRIMFSSDPPRILFLDQYGSLGGGQQVLLELVRSSIELGCRVSVLIPDGACADKLKAIGAQVIDVPECRLTQGRKTLFDVFRFLFHGLVIFFRHRRYFVDADLVYVNGNRQMVASLLAQILLKRKTVYHIHLSYPPLVRHLLGFTLRLQTTLAMILPSLFIHRELLGSDGGFADSRVRVLPNGLDIRFSELSFEDRFSDRAVRHIGVVGRVSPEKGQNVLLPLARRYPHIQFHLFGDAAFSSIEYYESLKRNAPSNLVFHGWIDDLPAKVSEVGLQICIIPSRVAEACSLAALELPSLSCLVVVRRIGALQDFADELDLPTFSTDAELYDLVDVLLREKGTRLAARCQTSYERVMASHGHSVFRDRLRRLWDNLLPRQIPVAGGR